MFTCYMMMLVVMFLVTVVHQVQSRHIRVADIIIIIVTTGYRYYV